MKKSPTDSLNRMEQESLPFSDKVEPKPTPALPSVEDVRTRKTASLDRLNTVVQACRKCVLGKGRIQAVPGAGNPDADLVFIGEAPGANEDKTGVPFVGMAGQVLTKNLVRNGVSREEIYICNIIKCRPPSNRDPLPEEITACEGYLHQQIEIIQPKLLCALGRFSAAVLLGHPIRMMQMRGSWGAYRGIPLFISLHPSSVLYQRQNLPLFEKDIDALAARYHQVRQSP